MAIDTTILNEIEKQRKEETAARENVKSILEANSAVTLQAEKDKANLTIQYGQQKSAQIAQTQADFATLDDLEANPIQSLIADIQGVFDGESGKENIAKRILRSERDDKLRRQEVSSKHATLTAKQNIAQAELNSATSKLSLEAQDVEGLRQQITDQIRVSQAQRIQRQDLAERLDVGGIQDAITKGDLTEFEGGEIIRKREDLELQRESIRLQSEQQKKNVADKNKLRMLGNMTIAEREALTDEALKTGMATDESGVEFSQGMLLSFNESIQQKVDFDTRQMIKTATAESKANASVMVASRAIGITFDPSNAVQSVETILQDPNVPDIYKIPFQEIKTIQEMAAKSEIPIQQAELHTEILKRAAAVQEDANNRDFQLMTKDQQAAGREYQDLGLMQDPISSQAWLEDLIVQGAGTGNSVYDAYGNGVRAIIDQVELGEDVLKQIAAGKPGVKSRTQFALFALKNATVGSENDALRAKALKTMMDTANAELLQRAINELGDPNVTDAFTNAGGDFAQFMRFFTEQETPDALVAFKQKLNEILPNYAGETFIPSGRSRYVKAAANLHTYDNDILAQFKFQFNQTMQASEQLARNPAPARQQEIFLGKGLGFTPLP